MSGPLIDHEKEKSAVPTDELRLNRETIEASQSTAHVGTVPPFLKWSVLAFGVLFAVALSSLFVVNRELPGFIERQLNAHVAGYQFTVGQATLSPTLSLEIRQLTVTQTEHPDPPVAEIPRWTLSIQWRQLLSGVLVSDYLVSRPTLHITLPQAKKELQDTVPIHQKGWRDALYSLYPIKINEFKIEDADITYVDQDPSKPLRFTHLNLVAGNIHNIRSPNDAYPSDLNLDGNIFGSGQIRMKGRANFLAEPHAGINVDLALQHVALEPLLPVTGRYNITIQGGQLSADGRLEYTPEGETTANLKTMTIEGVRVDYAHSSETRAKETQTGRAAVKTARQLQNKSGTLIRIDHGEITDSEFGFVNTAAKPPYRVFLSRGALHLDHISNHLIEGSGSITLTGAFMGTGDTVISGTFRPETKSPDFDLNLKIERTQLRAMNDLLRAYGNFDVTAGLF
ncbi:MAG TPA: DUF748 domain-containing protein, partial [Nitrospiraceae bacterium]|nr:DUF748 domain-containing protein [Nitrospiraceae bacterium]